MSADKYAAYMRNDLSHINFVSDNSAYSDPIVRPVGFGSATTNHVAVQRTSEHRAAFLNATSHTASEDKSETASLTSR